MIKLMHVYCEDCLYEGQEYAGETEQDDLDCPECGAQLHIKGEVKQQKSA